MQNDIRLHLANDEQTQSELEATLAPVLRQRFDDNVQAFSKHIPSIAKRISQNMARHHSIVLDKNGQINIVELATGRTFYTFNVDSEIAKQVRNYPLHSVFVHWHEKRPVPPQQSLSAHGDKIHTPINGFQQFTHKSLSIAQENVKDVDTLIVLGLGKAAHLAPLIQKTEAMNIVVYEPDWDLFYCSLYATDWREILEEADKNQRHLFLQFDTEIAKIHQNLQELSAAFRLKTLLVYKHYNAPSFDALMQGLRSGKLSVLEHPVLPAVQTKFEKWVPPWTPSIDIDAYSVLDSAHPVLQENMAAFAKYFPEIATKFESYESKAFLPIVHNTSGEVNLFHLETHTFLHPQKAQEAGKALAEHIRRYPNQDSLVFGYESQKQKHYLHNVFIRRSSTLLRNQQYEKGELPENVRSLILFGIETGYALEHLLSSTEIENAFICEPNPDFFYASLFAINWSKILKHIDEHEQRIYVNVGEAGSQLFADLNAQFMANGPHLLADTYFFQAYYNQPLHRVVQDLREQLRITFTLCENIDHVMYGIAHTRYALANKIPAMAAQTDKKISKKTRELPLFIVGNGPSLDNNIALLKEYRDQILVVSCGTALQALYKSGICPDFHAEVEQCRATFDWASRINDPAYLKAITLVSVNGIHPDTCALYKETLFAFKAGESSTVSALKLLGMEHFSTLKRAYPTVTNLAVNFFVELGFSNVYLLGVDLGFVDYSKHHSSQSGYFENGKQIYNYEENLAKSLPVKGNFRDQVFTKAEFNISRLTMQQTLLAAKSEASIDCYNLSDGVYIEGTTPLEDEQVLITNPSIEREACIFDIKNAFLTIEADVEALYRKGYSNDILLDELDKLKRICRRNIESKADVDAIIEDSRSLLSDNVEKGKSLFVYYVFGSLNNLSAALSKALMAADEKQALEHASHILLYFLRLLEDAMLMLSQTGQIYDNCAAFPILREKVLLEEQKANLLIYNRLLQRHLLSSVSQQWHVAQRWGQQKKSLPSAVMVSCLADMQALINDLQADNESRVSAQAQSPLLIVYTHADLHEAMTKAFAGLVSHAACLCYLPVHHDARYSQKIEEGLLPHTESKEALHFMMARLHDCKQFTHIIFKSRFIETGLNRAYARKEDEYCSDAVDYLADNLAKALTLKCAYSFYRYIAYAENDAHGPSITDSLGNRGNYIPRALEPYELLGQWYKSNEAVGILHFLQEHAHSV